VSPDKDLVSPRGRLTFFFDDVGSFLTAESLSAIPVSFFVAN
jgi:hypothetical protein